MSGSNMEMDRCGQHGSVESPTSSLRGLSNSSLPMASTDNLAATDTGKQLILNRLIKIIIAVINIRVIQLKRAYLRGNVSEFSDMYTWVSVEVVLLFYDCEP